MRFIKKFKVSVYKINGITISANGIGTAISSYCNRFGIHNLIGKELKIYNNKNEFICTYQVIQEKDKYPKMVRLEN